jgi:mannose-1-phosphate guanylyltransferase
MTEQIDAIVLVGGQGSRLRPLTLSTPKPMLPTAGVPFLAHLFSRIRAAGITHIVLGTSYRAEVFQDHFGDGGPIGLDIDYVVEDVPLGTGGAIGNVADRLRGPAAVVFNGDILSGVEIDKLVHTHTAAGADVTLHLTRVPDPRAFGCVATDGNGRVTAFMEKDPNPVTDQINAGTYVFDRSVIDAIPTGRAVSVERETFPGLLTAGAHVVGHLDATYWRDLGTPADFIAGSADLVTGIAPSGALPGPTGDALWLEGTTFDPSAVVTGGTTVGRCCVIAAGATVDGSVVFDGANIGEGATVRRSVVGRDAVIGAGTVIVDAVIGDRARIGAGNELMHGARVWPDAVLRNHSLRFGSA